MRRDLRAAARIQEAFLPRALAGVAGLNFAWAFQPCEELAGDALNICPFDEGRAGVYVLDVSGHGVAAALLSVTVARALSPAAEPDSLLVRPGGLPGERLVPPAEVAERLNQRFPWDPATEQFFTLVYGIVDARGQEFRYVSAGHPPGVYLPPDGGPVLLPAVGRPIGLGGGYREHTVRLRPGGRLYLYSDGVPEATSPAREPFGRDRLLRALEKGRARPLAESIALLQEDLGTWCGGASPHDDVSVLAVEAVSA
jgi:sigma-B regulation protein RsbU (phosphoserine phosphatase)